MLVGKVLSVRASLIEKIPPLNALRRDFFLVTLEYWLEHYKKKKTDCQAFKIKNFCELEAKFIAD